MKRVSGSTSKPKSLLKGEKKDVNKDDIDSNASCSPTPQSTANSTPSRSHSSAYSPSGPSCASSITSPNIQGSQLSETMARHNIGPTSDPLQYASTLYSYSRPDTLGTHPMTHISMAAGLPVRGSWDFSGVGSTDHLVYKAKEE